MKMLVVSTFFLFVTSFGYSQWFWKSDKPRPGKQCKALVKKKKSKPDNVVASKSKDAVTPPKQYYVYPVISPERLARERAEQKAEEATHAKAEQEEDLSKTELKFQTFQADNFEPVDVRDLPPPVNAKHSEIRKKVMEMIMNGQADQPITESLYFITAEDEFAYVDFEPFLMAVEFALQGKMVLVEGHTDSRGGEDYNLDLSMKRVRQIERLMREIGVPEDHISVMGYGENQPKYDNSTADGRQKNRRVDFKIY